MTKTLALERRGACSPLVAAQRDIHPPRTTGTPRERGDDKIGAKAPLPRIESIRRQSRRPTAVLRDSPAQCHRDARLGRQCEIAPNRGERLRTCELQ
jgi:hypothetical protein